MQELRKTLSLSKIKYYEVHLNIVNCVLPIRMTPREIEILAAFMSLEGDIAQYRFGPSAKKIIMNSLKLSPSGLSNFMGDLLEKGFLIKQGDLTTILPILMPEPDQQTYLFKLINIDSGNTTN